MNGFRCCAVVPTYDNAETLAAVVERIQRRLPDVVVVDDGSAAPGRAVCDAVARIDGVRLVRLEQNSGKGAAVLAGLREASRAGFSHAFQIDADGQHDLDRMPAFLAAAREAPGSAIFGYPEFDESVPELRRRSRQITRFWVDLEVGGRGIVRDAMIGFRIYPIQATLDLDLRSRRMDFDIECAVLTCWAGIPVVNLPVGVHYPRAEEGGRSHFRPVLDNVLISWLHSRLCTRAATRWSLDRLGLERNGSAT